jgi:hypothetical protein
MDRRLASTIEERWQEEVMKLLCEASNKCKILNIPIKWECVIGEEIFGFEWRNLPLFENSYRKKKDG